MKDKRYAIVRVQEKCPYYEIISKSCLLDFGECEEGCNKFDGKFQNGDTKEQLIRKVQQALFKSVFTEEVQKVVVIEEQERIYKQYRPMAEKVVEFLGVE